MEVQLLTEMVEDRDRRIASLQRRLEDQANKYSKILVEIKTVRNERLARSESNRTEWEKLQIRKNQIETRLVRMLEDLRKQQAGTSGSSLANYATVLNKSDDQNAHQDNHHGIFGGLSSALGMDGTDSSSVMRLQAQLCKVMHSMGIVDHQMDLVQQTCDSLIKSLKDVINTQTEEKSLLELKLMNELMVEDDQRRHETEKFKDKQAEYKKQIRKLEELVGEDSDDDDDEDETDSEDEEDEDEVDDEDDEERAEIRRALKEVQEQISEQEKENEEQNDNIRALKVRLSLLDMNISNGDNNGGNNGGDEDAYEDEGETASEGSDDEEDENKRKWGLSMVAEGDEIRMTERVTERGASQAE